MKIKKDFYRNRSEFANIPYGLLKKARTQKILPEILLWYVMKTMRKDSCFKKSTTVKQIQKYYDLSSATINRKKKKLIESLH